MKTAATYVRVSTDNQELDGTSLQTQLENCVRYCHDKGYDLAYCFSETYSGLTLDRPRLNEQRELVRNERIDVVVVYCLDRLSRNATHGVILRDELDKHHVLLESVTEDIDKTPLGEAITYLRGTFSQIEAEKIKERTMRGKRAWAKAGRLPGGTGLTIYGYDHIKASQENGGRRVIKEVEAEWVREMFDWLVNAGLTTNAITYRLRAMNAPTKSGGIWSRRSVQAILKNPAYTGKTYVFTYKDGRQFARPQADWVEIPNATPALISEKMFEAAQRQLSDNRANAPRNNKVNQYLLRGHLRCRQCGRTYVGGTFVRIVKGGERHTLCRYRCTSRMKISTFQDRCQNKGWSADKIEPLVWNKLQEYLSQPEVIINELEKQHREANELGIFESQLQEVERQLKGVDREQQQLLQWALKGFPEYQVETENRRLNKARETLKVRKTELETQIEAGKNAEISIPKLEQFIARMQNRIATLDFEEKLQVLDMLNITVWVDNENIEVTGFLDPEDGVIAHMSSTSSCLPPSEDVD